MITDDKAEKALGYLAETDAQYGSLCAHVKAMEHLAKTKKALAFLQADGTVAERESISVCDAGYADAHEEYVGAVAEMETVRARRKRAELTLELWRTYQANLRAGSV